MPLRRFKVRWPCPHRVAPMPADFRRVCCSTECCKRQGSEVVQVASVPPRLRHFCRARAVCPLPPSAAPFEAVSSSDELLHPFRSAAACVLPSGPKRTCVHPGGQRAPPMGFSSLIAAPTGGVHLSRGFLSPATVRPRRFARPRRFTPPPALRVYFAPQPRPGLSPFRGLSLVAEP
jgi:hypothetical protein